MIKRLFDFSVASVILLVTWPLILTVALAVWLDLGRPLLFVQKRPGLGGRPFRLYKFRTMRGETGESGVLPDRERLTATGRFLRSFSLDELPEFWNVLTGHMSIVGPRPLLMEYLPLYSVKQSRRLEVLPGLTGWAQINGRNALSWEERFELDVWYVDNRTFWLDLKIILRTVALVLRREGISEEGEATMSKFTGSVS